MLRRVPKGQYGGRAYESRRGKFYVGWGGEIFVFHLAMGRLTVTYEASAKRRADRTARYEAARQAAKQQ